MILLELLWTPGGIVAAFIAGVLGLFGVGAASNRNRKPGGKRRPDRKGKKR